MRAPQSFAAHPPPVRYGRRSQRLLGAARGRATPAALAVALVIASLALALLAPASPAHAGPQIPPSFKVESGTIRVRTYACPATLSNGAPAHAAAAYQLLDPDYGCQVWTNDPVTFVRNQGYGTLPAWQQTGSILYAGVIWDEVPLSPSAVTVAELIPARWGEPRVFCDRNWSGSSRDPGYVSAASEMAVVDSAHGDHNAIAFALTPSQDHVHCAWYNIPA